MYKRINLRFKYLLQKKQSWCCDILVHSFTYFSEVLLLGKLLKYQVFENYFPILKVDIITCDCCHFRKNPHHPICLTFPDSSWRGTFCWNWFSVFRDVYSKFQLTCNVKNDDLQIVGNWWSLPIKTSGRSSVCTKSQRSILTFHLSLPSLFGRNDSQTCFLSVWQQFASLDKFN